MRIAPEITKLVEKSKSKNQFLADLFSKSSVTNSVVNWNNLFKDCDPSFDYNELIEEAKKYPKLSEEDYVVVEHVILSVLCQFDKYNLPFLAENDYFGIFDLIEKLTLFIADDQRSEVDNVMKSDEELLKSNQDSFLPLFSTSSNLTEGSYCLGRETETTRAFSVLSKLENCNLILYGESGEGTTQFVRNLAYRCKMGICPSDLVGSDFLELKLTTLDIDENERRLEYARKLIQSQEGVILFIDNFSSQVMRSQFEDKFFMADGLQKIFDSPNTKIIISFSKSFYEKTIGQKNNPDSILIDRLEDKYIDEILDNHIENVYGSIYGFEDTDGAAKLIKNSLNAYSLKNRLNYIDLFFSYQNAKTCNNIKSLKKILGEYEDQKIEDDHLEEISCKMQDLMGSKDFDLTINKKVVNEFIETFNINVVSGKSNTTNLLKKLKSKVFGQDLALESISDQYDLDKYGIIEENRPRGIYLLLGPTGSGKTKTVEEFANITGRKLIYIKMSEFIESVSVSKLFGASPNYVGYDDKSFLIKNLKDHPDAVILLDEIEKAHKDVHDALLQVLDKGEFVSGDGETHCVRKCAIFMTSNIAADKIVDGNKSVGFVKSTQKLDLRDECKRYFRPEFINRIDRIETFQRLSKDAAIKILQVKFNEMNKKLKLKVQKNVFEKLYDIDYDADFGGRSLIRTIQKHIMIPAIKQKAKSVKLSKEGKIVFSER